MFVGVEAETPPGTTGDSSVRTATILHVSFLSTSLQFSRKRRLAVVAIGRRSSLRNRLAERNHDGDLYMGWRKRLFLFQDVPAIVW